MIRGSHALPLSPLLMASREFIDSAGTSWTVWNVIPGEMSSRLTRMTGLIGERRLPWLVFQSAEGEKRRLVPIPDGWEECDDLTLEQWATRAEHVPPAPARRVVDETPPDAQK